MRKTVVVVTAVMMLATLGTGVARAGGNDVIRQGSCSGSSDWKLKVSPEDAGLQVEFEVDQNVTGDRWRVKVRHDGELVFNDVRITRGDSGSFEVKIAEPDGSGTDRFKARARNLSTDEVCVGTASF